MASEATNQPQMDEMHADEEDWDQDGWINGIRMELEPLPQWQAQAPGKSGCYLR
jgi:hypothetical protein